jgi:hypothetical protein
MGVTIFFCSPCELKFNSKLIKTINLSGIEPNPCLPLNSVLVTTS